jgi:signal peptidase II
MNAALRYGLYGLISAAVVLLDQWTKTLIQQRMALHESIEIIPSLFSLTYIRNPGAAFGLFVETSATFRAIFFLVVTMIALAVVGYLFIKSVMDDRADGGSDWQNRGIRIGLTLVFGGAIGNLIDRVRYGEVVDFLDFYLGRYHWPAFNVADSSITVGVSLLFVMMLLVSHGAASTTSPAGGDQTDPLAPSSTPSPRSAAPRRKE